MNAVGGLIGASPPRPNGRRLLEGRARYVDDLALPRLAHVAFLRSPHAHATFAAIDTAAARAMPGVLDVVTGADLEAVVKPFAGLLDHFKGMKAADQRCMAVDRACWQGEAVAAVVAETRREAEDAVALLEVDWHPLPAVASLEEARDGTALVHDALGDNQCFAREVEGGDWDRAIAASDHVIERRFRFPRHTGVCPEGRSIIGDWNPADARLTVHISHQAPHMIQDCYARLLGLEEGQFACSAPIAAAPTASRRMSMAMSWRSARF